MMRKLPVPRLGSGRIGRPRIESHPSRSTSKGFIATATAGYSHEALCWSIAREIASRFLASEALLISSLRVDYDLLPAAAVGVGRVVDRSAKAVAQVDLRLPAQQLTRTGDVRLV